MSLLRHVCGLQGMMSLFFSACASYWGNRGSGGRVSRPMFGGTAVRSCAMVVVSLGETLHPPCLVALNGSNASVSLPQGTTIIVYHDQHDCVWMNGTWYPVRHTNPNHYIVTSPQVLPWGWHVWLLVIMFTSQLVKYSSLVSGPKLLTLDLPL